MFFRKNVITKIQINYTSKQRLLGTKGTHKRHKESKFAAIRGEVYWINKNGSSCNGADSDFCIYT